MGARGGHGGLSEEETTHCKAQAMPAAVQEATTVVMADSTKLLLANVQQVLSHFVKFLLLAISQHLRCSFKFSTHLNFNNHCMIPK